VSHRVDRPGHVQRAADVGFQQGEFRPANKVGNVVGPASGEVVYANRGVTAGDYGIT
jgi:hypothetical protein